MPRDITPLYQGAYEKTCGQTCVAMAAGVSREAAIAAVGMPAGTWGADLKRGLAKLGIRTGKTRTLRHNAGAPQFGIVNINYRVNGRKVRRPGHWLLVWDWLIYDPLPPDREWRPPGEFISGFDILDID